jgi:hypothetical protein
MPHKHVVPTPHVSRGLNACLDFKFRADWQLEIPDSTGATVGTDPGSSERHETLSDIFSHNHLYNHNSSNFLFALADLDFIILMK